MGRSSHIYVSVTRAPGDSPEQAYHKSRHSWMLSIEPHHTHVFGMGRKDPEPIHYAAARNAETGIYTINTHQAESEPAIIGNILVAESVSTSPEQLHKLFEEVLGHGNPNPNPSKDDNDDPEYWIRRALEAMQQQKIAQTFDLDEFMTWAHGYEANRIENEAPALVAYPRIHKDHEKKASKSSFWISHPTAKRVRKNDRGEAMTYGGLM